MYPQMSDIQILKKKRTRKNSPRPIKPSNILGDYMKETLRVARIRDKKLDGGKVTVTDDREIRNNDDKKVRVLNIHVFRSMANLIYFFEFLNKNPELIDKFVDDIEDLLGSHPSIAEDTNANIKYRGFKRLISSILGSHGPEHDKDNKFYFQRDCMRIIYHAVRVKVGAFTNRDKYHVPDDTSRINTQMFYAGACVDNYSIAPNLEHRKRRVPSRVLDF
jgi:hypothetical protein